MTEEINNKVFDSIKSMTLMLLKSNSFQMASITIKGVLLILEPVEYPNEFIRYMKQVALLQQMVEGVEKASTFLQQTKEFINANKIVNDETGI